MGNKNSSNRARSRAIRARMAADRVPYNVAARAVDQLVDAPAAPALMRPAVESVRAAATGPRIPARWTSEYDINPICGHHLSQRCDGCAGCMTCDGCYCGEDDFGGGRSWDGYGPSLEEEHANDPNLVHYRSYIDDCYTCELERAGSDSFTRCKDCDREISGGRQEWKRHQPCRWRTSGGQRESLDQPHPPGIDWTVLWGRRVTLNDRWLYHGDMAQYAGEWTGVIVPGYLRNDSYMPTLLLANDDGQEHEMGNMRHWTIELHSDDGAPVPFAPAPGPRLLGHLATVREDIGDRAVCLSMAVDGEPIVGGAVLDRADGSGGRRAVYRILRTQTGWTCYLRTGSTSMPWLRSGDVQEITGPDATWWQLTPGLEYRISQAENGAWSVHSLAETPCDFPDPQGREDCRWPAYGTVTRNTDDYTRAVCSTERHKHVRSPGQYAEGPLPADATRWTNSRTTT